MLGAIAGSNSEPGEDFEKSFPAQFIAEGLDQTRGWFYTLMVRCPVYSGPLVRTPNMESLQYRTSIYQIRPFWGKGGVRLKKHVAGLIRRYGGYDDSGVQLLLVVVLPLLLDGFQWLKEALPMSCLQKFRVILMALTLYVP